MAIEQNSAAFDGNADKVAVRQPAQSKFRSFCTFLYDRKNGTVLGRTGRSWFEITVFYMIFYACLAGFFAINMAIFLHTLDPQGPRYYGKGTIIGINPGMGYQPWIEKDPESTLIRFNPDQNRTYEKFVTQLKDFLKKYNYSDVPEDLTRDCADSENNAENKPRPCRFYPNPILEDAKCTEEDDFGFKSGQPCVLLTLNKLIDWEPVSYSNGSAPNEVRGRYNPQTGDVAVACEGEYPLDKENIGVVTYFPKSGINRRYFPYRVHKGYRQAFAIVKFNSPREGIVVHVECKAYSLNIKHDRTNRLGMVHFEIYHDPSAQ